MKFLIDAQLPPVLAQHLRFAGHDAVHVAEIGLSDAEDPPIWDRAVVGTFVIVTKDEDFAVRRLLTASGPQIVWLRVGNCSNRALLQWLVPLLPAVLSSLDAGEILVEVV